MAEEKERLKKEYEEKKRKKEEKEAKEKEKEKNKDKDKDDKKKDDDDKKDDKAEDSVSRRRIVSTWLLVLTSRRRKRTPRLRRKSLVFLNSRGLFFSCILGNFSNGPSTFYQQRLQRKRQAEAAKRDRERASKPDYFPSVPTNLPGK